MTSQSCDATCKICPPQQHAHHTFSLVNCTGYQVGPLMCQRHDLLRDLFSRCSKEQPRTITSPLRNYVLQEAFVPFKELFIAISICFPYKAVPCEVAIVYVLQGGFATIIHEEENPCSPHAHWDGCMSLTLRAIARPVFLLLKQSLYPLHACIDLLSVLRRISLCITLCSGGN